MKRIAGFTLLELMLVLALCAILAALAYPGWQGAVVRSQRVQAQAALLQLMQQQERYYTQNNTYLAFSAASDDAEARQFKWWSGASPAQSAYEIAARPCAGATLGECVQLDAVPGGAHVDGRFADADCQTLSLTSAGSKSASGAAPRCWP